jgi:hypothetical protein
VKVNQEFVYPAGQGVSAVKRSARSIKGGEIELYEKLGNDDLCPCGCTRRFQQLLP